LSLVRGGFHVTLLAYALADSHILIGVDSAATYIDDDPPSGLPDRVTGKATKVHQVGDLPVAWALVGTFGDVGPFTKWIDSQPMNSWDQMATELGHWLVVRHRANETNARRLGDDRVDVTEALIAGYIDGVPDVLIGNRGQTVRATSVNVREHFVGPMTATAKVAWQAVQACSPGLQLSDQSTMRAFLTSMCDSLRSHGIAEPVHVWSISPDGVDRD
jgi:hypothetical protein